MKISKHLLVLFLALTSVSALAETPAAKDIKSEPVKKTLRVLYWNIQNGMWAGQGDNYNAFVEWVKSKNPDICVFCEGATIYYTGTSKHMPNEERYLPAHWDELCARWGHEYVRVNPRRPSSSTPYGLRNYPCLVTSRYPIDSIAIIKGSKNDTLVVNYSGWYRINVPGAQKPLNVVTCHLKNGKAGYAVPKDQQQASADRYEGEAFRIKELCYIMDHSIRKSANPDEELWIMPGDYNSYSRKDNFKYRWNNSSLGFQTQDYMLSSSPYYDLVSESFPGVFLPSCGTNLRIDYFYVSKAMLNACCDVFAEADKYTKRVHSGVDKFYIPSDHYPIIADFKISKMK